MFNIYKLFYWAKAVISFTLYVQIVDGGAIWFGSS